MQGTGLKKGDMVKIIAGKEKGKSGKILKIVSGKHKIVVEKLNFVKRHQKPDARGMGGIVEKEAPIDASNAMLICNKCAAPVRTGSKLLAEGKRVRVCRKCNEILSA